MSGNRKLLTQLNQILTNELTSISQLMVHAEISKIWGYTKLSEAKHKHVLYKLRNTEWLIERIVSLAGSPKFIEIKTLEIATNIEEIVIKDDIVLQKAANIYLLAVKQAQTLGDLATINLLSKIIDNEKNHLKSIDIVEIPMDEISLQNYFLSEISAG